MSIKATKRAILCLIISSCNAFEATPDLNWSRPVQKQGKVWIPMVEDNFFNKPDNLILAQHKLLFSECFIGAASGQIEPESTEIRFAKI